MNVKKTILIILGIIVTLLAILRILTYKKPLQQIKDNLTYLGFSAEEEESIYVKQLSELTKEEYDKNVERKIASTYETLNFYIDTFQLIETKEEYSNEVSSSFTPIYDYKNNSLKYNYRITYHSTNVIFEGEYNLTDNTYTCEKIFAHDIDLNDNNIICQQAKSNIDDFVVEIEKLITNTKLLNYMKNSQTD